MIIRNPLRARIWFKLREPITLVASAAVGGVLFSFLWWCGLYMLAAAAIAFFAVLCLKFLVLDVLTLEIVCPKCGGIIDTTTPWLCEFDPEKEHRNENTDEFPFINECERCHKIQKAYVCHHNDCQTPIFLSRDRENTLHARRLTVPKEPDKIKVQAVNEADPREEKIAKQKDKIQDLTHKYEVTKLKKKIEIEKILPEKSEQQSLEKEIEGAMSAILNGAGKIFSTDEAADRAKAVGAEKFKDDPLKKAKWDAAVDDFAKKYKLKKLMEGK
ncbi:MAG: hypothetical protein ABSC89_00875 [Verrucomicrobiota bacterium]|jgi:rRNA maturation protein Nop10